jgi:hypothetical protein
MKKFSEKGEKRVLTGPMKVGIVAFLGWSGQVKNGNV